MEQLHETEYHYLNVVPNSRFESAHIEIQSLAIDPDCMIMTQLKEEFVHRNLIDSMIYAMYTRENVLIFAWFRDENSLYSIFIIALKQARRIQRGVDCDEAYDEAGCNDDDDS